MLLASLTRPPAAAAAAATATCVLGHLLQPGLQSAAVAVAASGLRHLSSGGGNDSIGSSKSPTTVVVDHHGNSSGDGGTGLLHDTAGATSYAELAASVFRSTEEVIGPLSLGDLVFGLQAVAKKHREQQLAYRVQGEPVCDRALVVQLLEATDLAYAAYKVEPQAAAAVSHLRLHNLRKFVPNNTQLRPAYFLAVDHVSRTIIWAIRGTHNVSDVITDISSSSTPLDGGRVHWGMLQASRALLREEMSHLVALSQACAGYQLLLVGHSLGAGVAALVAYLLNTRPTLRRQLRCCRSIRAVAVAPPPVMSEGLAAASEPFVTSLIYSHDPVPRLSPAAVSRLRDELLAVDWAAQLKSSVLEAEYTQAITRAISAAGSGTAQAAAQLQKLATELLQSQHLRQLTTALSSVVYGRAGQAADAGEAAPGRSSSTDGSDEGDASAAEFGTAWYLQQQHEEEVQQIQQWQQQLRQWQQQQRQQQQGGASDQQQQLQLEAWQVDVIRSWMDDVSQKLLPFVKGVPLPDADIKRVADAAVQSLTSSLGSIGSSIGSIGGSLTSAWSGSSGQASETQSTSSSSSSSSSTDETDSGWRLEKPPSQQQQQQQQQAAPWTGLQAAAGQVLSVISNAGQLLISIGPTSSSGSGGSAGSSGSGSSSDGLFGFTAETMMSYWRGRDKQQQQQQQDSGSSDHSTGAMLSGAADSSGISSLVNQAEAAAASTAMAAATAMDALPTAADLAASIQAAAKATLGPAPPAAVEATKATAAAAAASAAAAAGAAAAAEIVNLYPPGRLLLLMQQDLLQQEQQQAHNSSNAPSGAAAGPAAAAEDSRPHQQQQEHHQQQRRQELPSADDDEAEGHESQLGAAKAAAAAALGCLRPGDSSDGASGSSSSSGPSSSGLTFDPQVGFASSANAPGAESSSCRHVLLSNVSRLGHFDVLVLHPDMFADHRTRSYRAALLDLLKQHP